MDAGYRILRFTATDVYNRPDAVVALVRGSLAA
jgi:very-short-patch-repair endonuclease